MKKIYFTLGLSSLLFGANAQQTMKIKNPMAKTNHARIARGTNSAARNGSHNNVMQVAGGITSDNDYVAGSTMNLNFTVDFNNTDGEYCDSLAITFPAGFTVNSTNASPLFPTTDTGSGVVRDSLNKPVGGQTISWGKNDNGQYGGISTGAINFNVNVTITATVTGVQTVNFFASGDTYGTNPGDLSGTFTIDPAFSANLAALACLTTSGCAPTANSTVLLEFWNRGTAVQSGFPVKYIVNGGTPVVGLLPRLSPDVRQKLVKEFFLS